MKIATDDAQALPARTGRPSPGHAVLKRVFVIAGAAVAVDQLTKMAAAQVGPSAISTPAMNARFSMDIAGGSAFTMIFLAASAVVFFGGYVLGRANRGTLPVWVPAALIGGAVSNLADRVVLGGVRDFLRTPWALCNAADLFIIAGLIGCLMRGHEAGRIPSSLLPLRQRR